MLRGVKWKVEKGELIWRGRDREGVALRKGKLDIEEER